MAVQRKGNTTPAFRYFIFILFLCIFLFVFLVSRLVTSVRTGLYQEDEDGPTYRVEYIEPLPVEKTTTTFTRFQEVIRTSS